MRRPSLTVVTALALVAACAFAAGAQAKGGSKSATETVTNVPIATAAPSGAYGQTTVDFKVGKKFKGKVADVVQLTLQVTGTEDDYIADLSFSGGPVTLSAPNGRTVSFFTPFDFTAVDPNRAFGPITLTPNSPNEICIFPPGCFDNDSPLGPPWAGTAGLARLAAFYGTRMRGTWTMRIYDGVPAKTGILNLATLKVKPAKPIVAAGK